MPKKKKRIVRSKSEPISITPVEYNGLQQAYDHFNRALFGGALPDVFITLQRKTNSRGYFGEDRFSSRVGSFKRSELALNPDAFIGRSDKDNSKHC